MIFTDAMPWHPRWLDYGKIRVSKAKVGNDAPQYALTTRYKNASAPGANNDQQQFGGPSITFPFRGITSYISSTSLGNPTLKPETTVEDEIGLELRGVRRSGEQRSVGVPKVELRPDLLRAVFAGDRLHEHFAERGQPA